MQLREESFAYVEAVEAEVETIYRSRATVELPAGNGSGAPAEAYVCGLKREEGFAVFLALQHRDAKRNLVFSVAGMQTGRSGYETALKFALAACEALGLAMEGVALKFSTAMREVVVRNIPVLMAPPAAKRAAAQRTEELAELERLVTLGGGDGELGEAAAGLSPARRAAMERARKEREAEAQTAARKLAAESRAEEQVMAVRQALRALLPAEFALITASGAAALPARPAVAPQPEPPAVQAEPSAAAPAVARPLGEGAVAAAEKGGETAELVERERRERERLLAEMAAMEERALRLAEEARQAERQVQAERTEKERQASAQAELERDERERLLAAKAAAEERAEQLAAAAAQASAQAELERGERERLLAEKAAAEVRAAQLAEAAAQASAQAELERDERERLLAEKAAAEERTAQLAEAARQAEAQIESGRTEKERLSAAAAERERGAWAQLLAEKDAAEKAAAALAVAARQAAERFEAERGERERLMAEKAVVEKRAAALAKSAGAAARLAEAAQQAAERAEAERRERERLEVEKALVEQRLQALSEEAGKGEGAAAEKNREERRLPSLGGLFDISSPAAAQPQPQPQPQQQAPPPPPMPKRPARSSTSGAFFQVDWDLTGVAYGSPLDVLEVHQSINMTQLSLEGYPNQYCSAYVVAVKKGAGRQVFVVFRLSSSNRILVYAPPKQPASQEAYARAMQEAVKFLRVTGIETERLPLGKSEQSRAQALGQLPIFLPASRNAENF